MSVVERAKIRGLARFGLTTANAGRLAAFYESAFGCRRLATERLSGTNFERLMDVEGGARSITLCLGREIIELLQFDRPGRPYPDSSSSSDLVFQHFAIVVTNIGQGYQRLSEVEGWSAISSGGPQRLPDTSGGVTAFKFRDPDGHPLELLGFPDGKATQHWQAGHGGDPCLGIDHSAISVSDSTRSIAFYEGLGLRVSARSLNRGLEQGRLDGLREPRVEVTALAPCQATPHIELLCYRSVAPNLGIVLRNNDIAATHLVLETCALPRTGTGSMVRRSLLDPDGHNLLIVPPFE